MSERTRRANACLIALAACLLAPAAPALSQSIDRGILEGVVSDSAGAPFPGARVLVTDVASGVSWSLVTPRNGRFRLPLLPAGDYDVFVEQIGYQPVRIEAIPINPGRRQRVSVRLEPVQLPVGEVEVSPYTSGSEDSRAGASQYFANLEINKLPKARRELTELGRLSTVSNRRLETEQLPGWLSGFSFDGIPFDPARHPDLTPGPLSAVAFPFSGFRVAELYTNPVDVEWSESAGGYLSGYTRRGSERQEVRAYADWTGGAVTSSDLFSASSLGANTFRGGALLSGPLISDTAHYVLGFEAKRLETPLPPAWSSESQNAELLAVADSFGVDVTPYTEPRVATSTIGSGYGRFDWQITQNHALTVRGNAAGFKIGGSNGRPFDPGLGPDHIASLGAELNGFDLSGAATLTSVLSRALSQELRFAVERSDRDYDSAGPPGTRIADGSLAFGLDPTIPAEFKRFALRGRYTLHLGAGGHQLKAGVGALFSSVEQRYSFAPDGIFTFGGTSDFESLDGAFSESAGASPFARFRNWQLALYLQDTWDAAPGLEVTLGLRYEHERLDSTNLVLNSAWLERTGSANSGFDRKLDKYSPRFGFRWDVSQRGEWIVRGSAGIYHNLVPDGIYGELVTQNGTVETRRAVGALGSWPDPPDLAAAPVTGARLSLVGPDFGPPRTSRASLGLSRLFDDRTGLHISGTYRYTDFLPRRKDINLALAPSGQDQYGRPVYGTLVQTGSLLAVEPGTNRRFPDFDLVSAIDADGVSKYWDISLALERHLGERFDVLAGYTFSWGEDSWLSPNGGGPDLQLSPFPQGLNGRDWAEGNPDFDVPHRAVLGAQLNFPEVTPAARIAAFYRYESGRPFTPGFRAGVDANGDGSGRNDPAYIDPSIPGMESLINAWECLAGQQFRFAERNSCRGPDVHQLDVRLALGFFWLERMPVELVIDALNVLDSDTGTRDNALFLIDRDGSLETGADGTVTVPLLVNSNFGEPLVRHSSGRTFRFGLRLGL